MPSTFSLRERFELQADGENDSTWGQKANVVFQLVDEALSGYLSKSVAGTGNITLTASSGISDEVRQNVLNFTGVLTGARNVIVPTQEGEWFFVNNTTGAFTLTVKTLAGTGITIAQGFSQRVFCDGTNVLSSGPEISTATGVVNTAQPLDADLTALAAVTIATDQIIYGTGAATWGTTSLTAFMRTVLDDTTAAAARTTLGAAADADVIKQGKHTIWVPAGAMTSDVSNSPSGPIVVGLTANVPDITVLDFDGVAADIVSFPVAFPKSWNAGTITFKVFWTVDAIVTTSVSWKMGSVSYADGDSFAVQGTRVEVVDTALGTAVHRVHISAESSAVTIAGSPGDNEITYFRLERDPADASDTMTQDARLLGIQLFYTINSADDA